MRKQEIIDIWGQNIVPPFLSSPHTPYMDPENISNSLLPLLNELFPVSVVEDSAKLTEGSNTIPYSAGPFPYYIRFNKVGSRVNVLGWIANKTGIFFNDLPIFNFKEDSIFRPEVAEPIEISPGNFFTEDLIFRSAAHRSFDQAVVKVMVLDNSGVPQFKIYSNFPSLGTSEHVKYRFHFNFSYNAKK